MKTTTTIKSWPAITLGGAFALVTGYVMFAEVRSFADITPDHVTTAMILIGTVYAGHMIWPMLKSLRTCLHALGLVMLFVAGSWYCVVSSAGRNAETSASKASVVNQANGERQRLARALLDAEEEHKKARAEQVEACKGGIGKNCRSANALVESRKAAARDAHTAFLNAPPERIANGTTKQAARVFAVFIPRSEHELETAVSLLMPFAKALFLEIATLIFLGIGLGHRKVSVESVPVSVPAETPRALSFESEKGDRTDQEIEDIKKALSGLGHAVTNDQLASILGCSKSEASKRWRVAANAGVLEAKRAGKYVHLRLVKAA